VVASRETTQLAKMRYTAGMSLYLEVLDAERQLLDAELGWQQGRPRRQTAPPSGPGAARSRPSGRAVRRGSPGSESDSCLAVLAREPRASVGPGYCSEPWVRAVGAWPPWCSLTRRSRPPLVGHGIDRWGSSSVLSALSMLSSIAFLSLLLPMVVRETPLSRAEAPTASLT
jgi:hypothetical protein